MRDLWYQHAIVYCLDVETFQDGNGDGIGDFHGLIRRLDHLRGLGVDCIWLQPCYPTPNRDNGYDVVEYYGIDPRLGTLGDFVEFRRRAGDLGMRVVLDLVVNHTSDQHPWFQQARRDPRSPYRDYYVWSQERPPDADRGMVFPGVQDTIWSHDEVAGAWYLHRFYAHQPDLNIANPAVRAEIERIMGFWLELGVAGFRLDAAPFLIELKGIEDAPASTDPYEYLHDFREFLSWRRGDAVLLAEANVDAEHVASYLGGGDRLHMLFNFLVNQQLFLALAREDARPLRDAWRDLPHAGERGQWANFLRNHDELDLGRLTDAEREEVYAVFAPEPRMRLYGRGIRRRLAPMLGGDERRLCMAYSLLFSLPGTPVLLYGEEIGMGDALELAERDSVRTPMQWSDDANAGFSSAPRERLIRPVLEEGRFGFPRVNVRAQQRDPQSLLNVIERMVRTRQDCPELGEGELRLLQTGDAAVFAHACSAGDGTVVAVHNLSREPRRVELDLTAARGGCLVDLLGDRTQQAIDGGGHCIELQGYGYRWLRVVPRGG